MAVRKLRKNMKPIIWVITIAFFLSMLAVIVANVRMGMGNNQTAFKINGKKVDEIKVERTMDNISGVYSRYLGDNVDKELVSIIAFNNIVDRELTLQIAKKLKVKVSKGDIEEQYQEIEKSVNNKEQFKNMLQAQGYTSSSLKKEIKEGLTLEKTIEKIKEDYTPSEAEIKEEYEANKYGVYLDKTFEEVKEEVQTQLKERKGLENYAILLQEEKNKMKLTDVEENYASYVEKVEIEKDGFKITNVDIASSTLRNIFTTEGDLAKAKEFALESFEDEIKIAKEAINRGIKVEEALPTVNKFYNYRMKLVDEIKKNHKIDEAELKRFFNQRQTAYNTVASVDANIAVFKVEPSEKDKEDVKEEADKILKEVTPENFADLAKKYSQDPAAQNGGDLGWFTKGQMIKPFEDAAFEGEKGKVYPEVVETEFGYHIILVEDKTEDKVKARHILVRPKISLETETVLLKEAGDIVEQLQTEAIKFEDVSKGGKDILKADFYSQITEEGYIPGFGYKTELVKDIFDSEINKYVAVKADDGIFIFQKLKQVKFKNATYEEISERVKYDYLNIIAVEELKEIAGK